MKAITKMSVRLYARFISPIKGYECAHRVHQGGASCSEFYLDVLETHSLADASKALWWRLKSCARVARSARRDSGKLIIPCVPFI